MILKYIDFILKLLKLHKHKSIEKKDGSKGKGENLNMLLCDKKAKAVKECSCY